jgi:hypothetical protein
MQIFSIGSLIQNYGKCKSQKTLVWSHIVSPMKKDQQFDALEGYTKLLLLMPFISLITCKVSSLRLIFPLRL